MAKEKTPEEILGEEIHQQWTDFVGTTSVIKHTEEDLGEAIEHACRIIWNLWDDEAKREAMGWTSWNDLFHAGNEELAEFFNLIDDRIVLTSESNRNRFHNLLMVDSDPTIAEKHLLRQRNWTFITQFGSRISRLKEVMDDPDGPAKLKKVEEIIAPTKEEKPDPDPVDKDFELKREIGYWRGKKAVKLEDTPLAAKLKSRLTLIKAYYILKKGEGKILATNDERTVEVGTVLLPQTDEDYQDLMNWLSRSMGIQVVG